MKICRLPLGGLGFLPFLFWAHDPHGNKKSYWHDHMLIASAKLDTGQFGPDKD